MVAVQVMKRFFAILGALVLPFSGPDIWAQRTDMRPVSPDASPEARALLEMLYGISGHYTLTGQHNYPNTKNRNSEFAAKYTGKTPAIFSSDWGHAKAGNSDSYLARPDIVQEAIRQHQTGALVTMCWHAVPPTADEPITFNSLPSSNPKALSSVQGQLLDEQFKDVLTPGTALYNKWCAQVDAVAVFLKQLQDAHVPVLWRPYHEMNGGWFWWGGRTGEYSTAALYRQLFDRLVHHHHLNNLLWVWSVDRPNKPSMEHAKYFPGIEFVDILALDVYGNDFGQAYYESLLALSQGKPITLAEVGNPPTPEILRQQPKWTYFVTWAGMVRNTTKRQYEAIRQDPRVLGLDDPAYREVTAAYRQASHLPPLTAPVGSTDFSGHWVIDEERSNFGQMGAAQAPAILDVVVQPDALKVRTAHIVEWGENEVSEERFLFNGTATKSQFRNSPMATTALRSKTGDKIIMDTTIEPSWAPPGTKMNRHEEWTLQADGKVLLIQSSSTSPRGEQKSEWFFNRE
jgi:mannan endo-1,4-beta-mannosidase